MFRRFIVSAWMPLLFVACGEAPSSLDIDPETTKFVYYNCNNTEVLFCGLWIWEDGFRYDFTIRKDGTINKELIE